MNSKNLIERLEKFNRGRDAELLVWKYQKMQENPFTFLRGSCHLFYEDWHKDSSLNDLPKTWLCGDLHLENFGSYKGDNRLTYFDLNDFDEAALGSCSLDLARLLTSIFLSSYTQKIKSDEAKVLCNLFLQSYCDALVNGKARWLEREIAEGLIKDLLDDLHKIERKDFLDKRTVVEDKNRKIVFRENKTRLISLEEKERLKKIIEDFASTQENPEFFEFIDAAWRIAGTGSLGLERYIILVKGKGSPHKNYLLDLKAAQQSSIDKFLKIPQPKWHSEAERVINVQKRMQAISLALLKPIKINGCSYILREYQPSEEKIDLESASKEWQQLKRLMADLGKIVAWGQLRSSGRQGSAIADELIDFGRQDTWQKKIVKYAHNYSETVKKYWKNFQELQKF
jgi:uncharacterized protein (DUF2252 family)